MLAETRSQPYDAHQSNPSGLTLQTQQMPAIHARAAAVAVKSLRVQGLDESTCCARMSCLRRLCYIFGRHDLMLRLWIVLFACDCAPLRRRGPLRCEHLEGFHRLVPLCRELARLSPLRTRSFRTLQRTGCGMPGARRQIAVRPRAQSGEMRRCSRPE